MPNSDSTFRRLALSLPDAVEGAHMGSADFRLNGRIFATLAYVSRGLGTLKLTPEQQGLFLAELPEYTEPAPGGWGRMGMTLIRLDAPEAILLGALTTAYNHVRSTALTTAAGQRTGRPRTATKTASKTPRRLQ